MRATTSQTNRETKLNVTRVIDFLNSNFASQSGERGRWSSYLLDAGLKLKHAETIKQRVAAAHSAGGVAPLRDIVQRYVETVSLETAPGGCSFKTLYDISSAERILCVTIVTAINDGAFWRLKRCLECSRFFLPRRKQQHYCTSTCLDKKNSKSAQTRVKKARRNKRLREIRPKLVRLREMAKEAPLSEIVDRLPGFDARLLAEVVEHRRSLDELAPEIKYRNRRILINADLERRKNK